MCTVPSMKMCAYLVFDTPGLYWHLSDQVHNVARFSSTRGAAVNQLPISADQDLQSCHDDLVAIAAKHLPFSEVEDCTLRTYFFGVSVLQYVLNVELGPVSQAKLEQWDSLTDVLQDAVLDSVAQLLETSTNSMWTTVMFVSSASEKMSSLMHQALPEATKTIHVDSSGFVNEGLCGIGMSWIELDDAVTATGEPTPLDVIVATARDAIASCAAVYLLYDRVVADYGKWLQRQNPRSRSGAATQFRYVESIRVHRNLRLGPSERGLNDGLWEVWGMPVMVSSLESLVDRFENETQSATQIAIGRAQNALAITAALIVPFVSVDEIKGFLGDSVQFSSSSIIAATALVEALLALAIYGVARRRRRSR